MLRYQCSDGSTYEPVPGSSNQRSVAVGEQEVQPVGMPVSAARVAVVERDIQRAAVAAKDAETLRREQIGFQCGSDEWRKVLARE